jgi:hypothetical protein
VEYIVVLTKFDIYVLIAAHLILSNIGFTTYYCRKKHNEKTMGNLIYVTLADFGYPV